MKTIKFRAWDKGQGKMINNVAISFLKGWLGEDGKICFDDINCIFKNTEDRLVWMQYINLKDKSGKEIYEGDIVRYHAGLKIKPYNYIIEWCIDGFRLHCEGFGYEEGRSVQESEVIGNIYQNKDLLK